MEFIAVSRTGIGVIEILEFVGQIVEFVGDDDQIYTCHPQQIEILPAVTLIAHTKAEIDGSTYERQYALSDFDIPTAMNRYRKFLATGDIYTKEIHVKGNPCDHVHCGGRYYY